MVVLTGDYCHNLNFDRPAYYIFEMNSEQSSFREIYEFPNADRKQPLKNRKNLKKRSNEADTSKPESFDKFVRKTKNVVLFAQKLKQQIAEKRTFNMHTLTTKQLEYLQNQSSLEELTTFFSNDSRFIFVFEVLFVTILLIFIWKNSYQIAFTPIYSLLPVNILILVFYVLQVVLFCFTEYKNERQQTITDRRQIWQIYLEDKFLKDVTVAVILILQIVAVDEKLELFGLYIVLRLVSSFLVVQRVRQSAAKLQNELAISTNAQTIIAIVKLLFKIFVFLHCLSIILNLLAEVQTFYGHEKTWLTDHNFNVESSLDKYVVAWYWGATILSTVGFGDITPTNNIERFFVSIVQVFCCMAFGYFVNVIGTLLRLRTERDEVCQKQTRSLNRYLGCLNLSQDLKFKVRSHFLNKHMIGKIYDPGEEKIVLENLTVPLKSSLLEQNNINVLKKSLSLEKFQHQTLVKVAQLLKRVVFAPEHLIYSRDTQQQKLWFLESGAIEEFTDNFKDCSLHKKIAHYQKQDCTIGWNRFLTQSKYRTRAKACKLTVAYELEQAKFISALQENPKQWHKLLGIGQLLIENHKQYLQKCLSCDRYTHNVIDCPRIHYIRRNAGALMKQENTNISIFRAGQMKKKKKFNRQLLRDNWKKTFQGEQTLGKLQVFQGKEEENKILNMTIDHFIRNLTRLNSLKQISNKRISVLTNRLGSRDSKASQLSGKEIVLNPSENEKSLGSLQIVDSLEEQLLFDIVLLDKESKQYLPQHHIDQVLRCYSQIRPKIQEQGFLRLISFRNK